MVTVFQLHEGGNSTDFLNNDQKFRKNEMYNESQVCPAALIHITLCNHPSLGSVPTIYIVYTERGISARDADGHSTVPHSGFRLLKLCVIVIHTTFSAFIILYGKQ